MFHPTCSNNASFETEAGFKELNASCPSSLGPLAGTGFATKGTGGGAGGGAGGRCGRAGSGRSGASCTSEEPNADRIRILNEVTESDEFHQRQANHKGLQNLVGGKNIVKLKVGISCRVQASHLWSLGGAHHFLDLGTQRQKLSNNHCGKLSGIKLAISINQHPV